MDISTKLLKVLLDRSTELERKRTRALATQHWATVIEVDAQLHENELVRKQLADLATKEENETTTTTPSR